MDQAQFNRIASFIWENVEAAPLWQPLPSDAFQGETDYPRYRVIARLREGASAAGVADLARAHKPAGPGLRH